MPQKPVEAPHIELGRGVDQNNYSDEKINWMNRKVKDLEKEN